MLKRFTLTLPLSKHVAVIGDRSLSTDRIQFILRIVIVKRRVVIISDPRDVHIPPVAQYLDDEPIVIDPICIISSDNLSYSFIDGQIRVIYKEAFLDNVGSVWYRKPQALTTEDLPCAEEYRPYALSALEKYADALNVEFPEALWLSDYFSIKKATPKPRQLDTAARLGFSVPQTLFTSDAKQAEQFLAKQGTCVVKTMAIKIPPGKTFYTTIIKKEEVQDFTGLQLAPTIFQQFIRPVTELRVTVVGSQVFAATVENRDPHNEKSPVRDWRIAHNTDTFSAQAIELPDELKEKCLNYLETYDLRFGAFDFIIDENGTTWFLECNPNGQWLFIEEETGLPIARAIANLLTSGRRIHNLQHPKGPLPDIAQQAP